MLAWILEHLEGSFKHSEDALVACRSVQVQGGAFEMDRRFFGLPCRPGTFNNTILQLFHQIVSRRQHFFSRARTAARTQIMTIQTQERYFALPCMKWLLAFPLAATTEIAPRCDFEVVQAVLGC